MCRKEFIYITIISIMHRITEELDTYMLFPSKISIKCHLANVFLKMRLLLQCIYYNTLSITNVQLVVFSVSKITFMNTNCNCKMQVLIDKINISRPDIYD